MQSLVETQKFFLKSLAVPNYDQNLQEFGRSFRSFDYEKASLEFSKEYNRILPWDYLLQNIRFQSFEVFWVDFLEKKEALWTAFDIVF